MPNILTDNDDILINSEDDIVYGLDGNDRIVTRRENVVIYGGDGGDFIAIVARGIGDLYGERGNDTMHGAAGSDRLYGGSGTDLLIGGDVDYTVFDLGQILPASGKTSGDDTLHGGDGIDSLWGFDGDDVLHGGEGNDTNLINISVANSSGGTMSVAGGLYGGAGNDYLDGGRGNDYLDGGTGSDVMLGGLGDDFYVVDSVGDAVLEAASSGLDTVRTTLDRYVIPIEVETLELQGSANLTAYGRASNDSIYGNIGNNILFGDAGNDFLDGGLGNDTYSGGAGDDLMRDTFGNDQFVFTGAWGKDTIQGFEAGPGVADTIFFEKSVFANIEAVVAAWSDVGGNVVINAGNGNTVTILGVTTAQLAGNDFTFG